MTEHGQRISQGELDESVLGFVLGTIVLQNNRTMAAVLVHRVICSTVGVLRNVCTLERAGRLCP